MNDNSNYIDCILNIDYELLKSDGEFTDLFYLCPLIERLLVENLDLVGENVEHSTQGKIRSATPLIDKSKKMNIITNEEADCLYRVYGNDGIRNKLFHSNYLESSINEDEYTELIKLIIKLINTYNDSCERNSHYKLHPIDNL